MQPKYFSFDTEGKRIYITKMEDFLERLKIFTFRRARCRCAPACAFADASCALAPSYEMSDDPYARECMRRLNAQLLEAGLTLRGMTTQFDALLGTMRADLDAEARRGVSPAPAGGSRAAVQGGGWGAAGMPDMAALMADPDIREAMADPSVVAVLQQCMADPTQIMQHRCARCCAFVGGAARCLLMCHIAAQMLPQEQPEGEQAADGAVPVAAAGAWRAVTDRADGARARSKREKHRVGANCASCCVPTLSALSARACGRSPRERNEV